MRHFSNGFSQMSNGVLKGSIGAIDGWLVRILRPSLLKNGLKSAISFYSRKHVYALHIQVVVDDQKKVPWLEYSNGGLHDSRYFRNSNLYEQLKSISQQLYDKVILYLVTLFIP